MESIRIEILNPKARKLLKNLADLKLIKITDTSDRKNKFMNLLEQLRSGSQDTPSIEEITKEVEDVRNSRYEEKN